ncbi:uncharacterized protein LOC125048665 [Pieris napi]|uniref:uncharacterized protein LOC125048665 n=1 Tax=Pieris napi TaxID=78633 RepID=UPI001FBB83FC|nr:uncharacterized protein LOC125048665 [Pieris napi]
MAVVWSNDKIMQLIELFQSKPLLWDCSIKQYKDRNKKNDAFEEISQVLNIPKKDVETKIHVLRTQFTREKKKMSAKKTTGSGAIEKCKWIYYEPLEFLLCGATTSGETDTMNKTVDENNALESGMESEPSQSPRPNATTSTSSRKRNKTDESNEILEVLKSAKKKMDEREKKDPFDIYGEYIAAELRSVKDDQAVTQAKYHINTIYCMN